jgi:hypothetical protein
MTCEIDGSLSLEDRTEALKETIKNRLSHTLPTGNCVKALVVLVDSKEYSGGSGSCKFRIKLYIQTRKTTVRRLQSWLSDDCKLKGLKGGLCGTNEFDEDMKKPAPLVVLPLFSVLKLNNAGRAAKRVIDQYIIACSVTCTASNLNRQLGSRIHFSIEMIASSKIHCIRIILLAKNQLF